MNKFFNPSSIAIYGVSSSSGNLGGFILANLKELGYQGRIYGVGPHKSSVRGYPVYESIKDIPDRIDLVAVVTPAQVVPAIFRECGELGIRRIVVTTAGFNEIGGRGLKLADEILAIAKRYDIRFIGPNCQGIIDYHSGLCLHYGILKRRQIKKSKISVISQSGSVGWIASLILSHEINGLSKVISIGNKLSIDEIPLVEYLMKDNRTDVILLHLESLSDGRRLYGLLRHSRKPIIVLKSNRGSESHLALSHTGALASDDRVVDAAFRQAGIIRAETFGELLDWGKAMSGVPLKGPNVVAMVCSGGMAIMCEDACRKSGLNLIEIPDHIRERLWDIGRPKIINYTNPIDLGNIFNNEKILIILRMFLSLKEIDGVIFTIFNEGKDFRGELASEDLIHMAYEEAKEAGKAIAFFIITDPEAVFKFKQKADFPFYNTVEDAVESLRKKLQWTLVKSQKPSGTLDQTAYRNINRAGQILSSTNDYYLDDIEALELLGCYGINGARLEVIKNPGRLSEAARDMGYPVAMKIHSRDISHKSDAKGVRLDIKDDEAARQCYAEMLKYLETHFPEARIDGVKIQRMVPEGIDVIVGGKNDKDFGPVLMVGLGGVFTEVINDVVFRLAPVSKEECLELLKELRGYRIFTGIRGREPSDLNALSDLLMSFSRLLVDFPQISEADLNPVRLFKKGSGTTVLDARIFLEEVR